MINTSNSPTFWELCREFDEENAKDPVYLSLCMFLLRTVWGTIKSNMNFVLSQGVKWRWFKFDADSDICKWLLERHAKSDISTFEKKLSVLVD